jgi:biotin transport system substrate-specific component
MAQLLTTPNTVLGVLAPRSAGARFATAATTVVLGSLILALSAQVKVPMIPVPMTLTTLAVALFAGAFGWRIGVATVALYVVEGLSGLPFFASGGGIGYLLSPTFGFIVGYLPMAALIGLAADRGWSRNVLTLFAAMLVGDAACFVLGYLWLFGMAAGATWIDQSDVAGSAFAVAVQPFLLGDLLKMAIAASVVAGSWTLLTRRA